MTYDFNTLKQTVGEATSRPTFYTDFEDVPTDKLHQISELTEWIRTKSKGSDIREIIAQLFERTWLEGVREGNANMEVSQARAKFVDLSARLANIEGIMEGKADDEKIKEILRNILDGSPKGTFANLTALKQAHPTGGSGIYITSDNKNWNYWNGSTWVAGGVYQAAGEMVVKQVSDGKTNAYIKTAGLVVNFDEMKIIVNSPVIVDGVNNIWSQNYEGTLTNSNGFLVFNKVTKRFNLSPVEIFDKDNIILGFFWADGSGYINSISRYDIKKNGVWKTYNAYQINTATLIGGEDFYIENFTLSNLPKVQLDYQGKKVEWNITVKEIKRVNNATSGYILFDSVNKNFILKAIETDLRNEPETMYYVTTIWSNGYYIENGALKNKPKITLDKTAPNARIVTLGDSITQGLKNYNSPRELYEKSWPNYMLEQYGGTLRNIAVSGKSIAGTGPEDFNGQVNSVNFADFDLAIIAMGVNDFNNQNNIETVVESLKKGLNKIFADNKNIQVAGILPHNLFRLPFTQPANTVYVDGLKFADRNGKTLNDFCDALAEVYKEYQIPYIDWRKAPVLTMRNYNKWTWDAIHPNEAGHTLIGRRVAEWLKVNV